MSPNRAIAKQRPCILTPAPIYDDGRRLEDLKDDAKKVGINGQATEEVEVVVKEAGVTGVPSIRSHPIQSTDWWLPLLS